MDPPAPPGAAAGTAAAAPGRWQAWSVYASRPARTLALLGFAAGLPLLLVLGTLSFRLREAGVDRATIGYLSWIGLTYAAKWAWAPLVDRLPLPVLSRRLGRRRAWLLAGQGLVIAGLVGMAAIDPREHLGLLVAFAWLAAFGSATQDIALDAYRIESAPVHQQPALAAMYQAGYRLAMIWAGAGTLWIAAAAAGGAAGYAHGPWQLAYLCMAASMAVGVVTVLFASEPAPQAGHAAPPAAARPRWAQRVRAAVLEPFADFFRRHRWDAALILALIATYRISDVVMGIMANPFYVDLAYTKEEVALISKSYGVAMTLAGAFAGGAAALRIGLLPTLFAGAALSSASNLLFAGLAVRGHDPVALAVVVSADNFSAGVASAAFVGYLSSLTRVAYSATQYALFSSVMLLLPKFVAGFSGAFVDRWGYEAFFVSTALLGVPVLALVALVARRGARLATSQRAGGVDTG